MIAISSNATFHSLALSGDEWLSATLSATQRPGPLPTQQLMNKRGINKAARRFFSDKQVATGMILMRMSYSMQRKGSFVCGWGKTRPNLLACTHTCIYLLTVLCSQHSGVGEANRKWRKPGLAMRRTRLDIAATSMEEAGGRGRRRRIDGVWCPRPSKSLHGCWLNQAARHLRPCLRAHDVCITGMIVVGRAVVRRLLSHLWLAHSFLFLRCDHHDGLAVR